MEIKLDEVKLNEIIRGEIRRMLNDELSISEYVINTTNEIYTIILRNILSAAEFDYDFGEYGVYSIHVEKPIVRMDKEPNAVIDLKNRILRVEVPIFNGDFDRSSLKKTIMHEVEHLFQKGQKTKIPSKYEDIYDKAVKVLMDEESDYTSIYFAKFIYCCSELEQDAFANELYQELDVPYHTNKDNESEIIHNSSIYTALYHIRDVIANIKDGTIGTRIESIVQYYGKNENWFINLGINAEKRIIEKIRKVYTKSKKDRLTKFMQKVPLTPIRRLDRKE